MYHSRDQVNGKRPGREGPGECAWSNRIGLVPVIRTMFADSAGFDDPELAADQFLLASRQQGFDRSVHQRARRPFAELDHRYAGSCFGRVDQDVREIAVQRYQYSGFRDCCRQHIGVFSADEALVVNRVAIESSLQGKVQGPTGRSSRRA